MTCKHNKLTHYISGFWKCQNCKTRWKQLPIYLVRNVSNRTAKYDVILNTEKMGRKKLRKKNVKERMERMKREKEREAALQRGKLEEEISKLKSLNNGCKIVYHATKNSNDSESLFADRDFVEMITGLRCKKLDEE